MVQAKARRIASEAYADKAKTDAIADATTKYGGLVDRGQRGYTIDQTAGRTVKVWDYINNREQLIYGDTGVRDISGLLTVAGAVISFTLRREGNTCFMALYNLTPSAGGSGNLAVIPAGFRPTTTFGAPAQGLSSRWQVTNQGNVQAYNWTTAAVVGFLVWATSDPWPTTLPGTASGTIPYQ